MHPRGGRAPHARRPASRGATGLRTPLRCMWLMDVLRGRRAKRPLNFQEYIVHVSLPVLRADAHASPTLHRNGRIVVMHLCGAHPPPCHPHTGRAWGRAGPPLRVPQRLPISPRRAGQAAALVGPRVLAPARHAREHDPAAAARGAVGMGVSGGPAAGHGPVPQASVHACMDAVPGRHECTWQKGGCMHATRMAIREQGRQQYAIQVVDFS